MKIRSHKEPRFLVMSPPTRESRQVECVRMTLVNKRPADRSGTAIEIFVRTPCGEINIPIMHFQLDIPGGVCQIETYDGPGLLACFGDSFHVKSLAGVVIHAAKQDKRY